MTSIPQTQPAAIQASVISDESLGIPLAALNQNFSPSAANWPVANLAVFIPLIIPDTITIVKLWHWNGNTIAGNLDVGLFTDIFGYVTSSGSTAQAGATAKQDFDIADITVRPGLYYLACAMDSINGRSHRCAPGAINTQVMGVVEQANAFPLPVGGANPVAPTNNYLPYIGISQRVVT